MLFQHFVGLGLYRRKIHQYVTVQKLLITLSKLCQEFYIRVSVLLHGINIHKLLHELIYISADLCSLLPVALRSDIFFVIGQALKGAYIPAYKIRLLKCVHHTTLTGVIGGIFFEQTKAHGMEGADVHFSADVHFIQIQFKSVFHKLIGYPCQQFPAGFFGKGHYHYLRRLYTLFDD